MGLAQYAGPGHWNDPDMLEVGNGGMTDTEYRSHFSLWAIMAAPLLIGSDLRRATPETMEILLNSEVIALDQDPLGEQGVPIESAGGRHVFVKELADGDRGVALFNETDRPARIDTTAEAAGLRDAPAYTVRDLWTHTTRETAGRIASAVPAHGTVVYRVARDARWNEHAPLLDDDLRVEPPYEGGPAIVSPGDEAAATTTVTNLGRVPAQDVQVDLDAPAGLSVRASSPTTADEVGRDRALETTWATGLGAHAPGEIAFYLGRRCSHVAADVGVDDEKSAKGSVTFELWADGTKVADSGLMTTSTPARTLEADLDGATILRLVVTDGGNGNDSDHADWGDARIVCGGGG